MATTKSPGWAHRDRTPRSWFLLALFCAALVTLFVVLFGGRIQFFTIIIAGVGVFSLVQGIRSVVDPAGR